MTYYFVFNSGYGFISTDGTSNWYNYIYSDLYSFVIYGPYSYYIEL